VDYILHVMVLVGIYIILSQGLSLLLGFTGVVSVMQAAFYGVGAYLSALASLRLGLPFGFCICSAMVGGGLCGYVVGALLSRLKGDYLALATFGLNLVFYDVFNNWLSLTRGPMGLPGIVAPTQSKWLWVLFVGGLVGVVLVVVTAIGRSPFGRLLMAIRDDEELASVLGKNTRRVKILAFILSAIVTGLAGSLYAHYITFIDPTSFTVMESVTILTMVIIGGLGSARGAVAGAVLLICAPEALRFVGLPTDVAASLRQALFGFLLVLVILYRPQGLFGRRGITSWGY